MVSAVSLKSLQRPTRIQTNRTGDLVAERCIACHKIQFQDVQKSKILQTNFLTQQIEKHISILLKDIEGDIW